MKTQNILLFAFLILIFSSSGIAETKWSFDIETGGVFSGYNDVQIPKSTGTLISLSKDLDTQAKIITRFRFSLRLGDKHNLSVFAAPLSLKAEGTAAFPILFNGDLFASGTPLDAVYRFNSYRLTYRYDFIRKKNFRFGLGFSAKIRDAAISLENNELKSEKTNVGFVPLINLRLEWFFIDKLGLLLEGDFLGAKQGRAEDIFLGLQIPLGKNLLIKSGYRVIEGGANVEEVYNFAFLNFIVAGVIFTF